MRRVVIHTTVSGCLLALVFLCGTAVAAVLPRNLTCEYRVNPAGIDILNPRLSWELASNENGELQSAYRVLVSSSRHLLDSNVGDAWDTQKTESDQSVNIPYEGVSLRSGRKYYWKVKAWGKDGRESDWSKPAEWSTGLLDSSDWKAKWIGMERPVGADDTTGNTRLSARYLRREFGVRKGVQSATVYVCGLGLYELSFNGRRIGRDVLAPAQTQFDKTILYNTFDVTEHLVGGANAIGVILGNGRYFTMRSSNTVNFGFPRLLVQLDIAYGDGSHDLVTSDGTWKVTADGPITENNEYDGEKYDARKEMKNWDRTGFDDRQWARAELVAPPQGILRAQMNEPIRVTETLHPVSLKEIRPGVHIFDMGQNMVGWVRLRAQGKAGTRIRLRFAESLSGDSLYVANLRGAEAMDEYVCRGDGIDEWEPRFTYHGFRYVELTGFPGRPDMNTIEGKVVHDDVASIGDFSCSNVTMNRIFRNAVWGIRGNYRSFPTDCPQRDERHGWLGDRAMGSRGESFIFNIASLYRKWIGDIVDAQRDDGSIPDVCPAYWTLYSDNVTWDGTPIVLIEMLRTQYSDQDIVRRAYPALKKWHDYMTAKYLKDGLMPRDTYGDWCVPPDEPEAIHTANPLKTTQGSYIGSAYFIFLSTLMRDFAALLGNAGDEQEFARQAGQMKEAFNRVYWDPVTRTYSNNTATANILALAFDLPDSGNTQRVLDNLLEGIETRFKGHIPTGLVGAQFLMRTLTRFGRADIAYRFATQTTYPSWGYMIRHDATTIWELWNGDTGDPGMNSQNHVMLLGDLITWYFENLAGIKSSVSRTGFKHVIMEPTLIAGLDSVAASFHSLYGPVTSRWKVAGDRFDWRISVPPNATAVLHIPAGKTNDVLENGRPIAETDDFRIVGSYGGRVVVEVPSGRYHFSSTGFSVVTPPKLVATPRFENTVFSGSEPVPIRITCDTDGVTIRYTTDDTTPTEQSPTYKGPFPMARSGVVRARGFKAGYVTSYEARAEVEIHPPRRTVEGITYVTPYSPKYPPANGDRTLIDREEGSLTYADKKWVGYEGMDMEVVLDLGKPATIHRVVMRFLSTPRSWVFFPEAIEVSVSGTTDQFTPAATVRYGVPTDVYAVQKRSVQLNNVEARYIKVRVKNYGKCPDWHTSAGGDAWIFVDEIYVE